MLLSKFRLDYLIGAKGTPQGRAGVATVVPFDSGPCPNGFPVGYCNFLDEENRGKYPPYLKATGTAKEYKEGLIDPNGVGFLENVRDQLRTRRNEGFSCVELDNADSYEIADVIRGLDLARLYRFSVIAKNPENMKSKWAIASYLAHDTIIGAIVEQGCGSPRAMDVYRANVGKPDMPAWFVAYGQAGLQWLRDLRCERFLNMYASWSRGVGENEYSTSEQIKVFKG